MPDRPLSIAATCHGGTLELVVTPDTADRDTYDVRSIGFFDVTPVVHWGTPETLAAPRRAPAANSP
jgi:hypothetical protein